MSAYGPKQTWACAVHMSAFGGRADMSFCGNPPAALPTGDIARAAKRHAEKFLLALCPAKADSCRAAKRIAIQQFVGAAVEMCDTERRGVLRLRTTRELSGSGVRSLLATMARERPPPRAPPTPSHGVGKRGCLRWSSQSPRPEIAS